MTPHALPLTGSGLLAEVESGPDMCLETRITPSILLVNSYWTEEEDSAYPGTNGATPAVNYFQLITFKQNQVMLIQGVVDIKQTLDL